MGLKTSRQIHADLAGNTGRKKGRNWSYVDRTITFFDVSGRRYLDGTWAIGQRGSSQMRGVVHEPSGSPSGQINDLIKADCRAGRGREIAYVGIDPEVAVMLFLEGVITLAALEAAHEDSESILLSLHIGGTERSVVVSSALPPGFATYDLNHQII